MEITDLGRKGLITTYWGDRKERTYRNNLYANNLGTYRNRNNLGRDRQTKSGKERKINMPIPHNR